MKKIFSFITLCFVCLLSACSLFTLDADGRTTIGILGVEMNVSSYNAQASATAGMTDITIRLRLRNTESYDRAAIVYSATFYSNTAESKECDLIRTQGYDVLYYLDLSYYTISVTVDDTYDLDNSTIVYNYNDRDITIKLKNV